jgi:type IV pilus assembly protein PilC
MPAFTYIAKNEQGKDIRGTIEASSLKEARMLLEIQGIYPTSVRLPRRNIIQLYNIPRPFVGVKTEEIIIFTEQLSTLIASGLSILETLDGLAGQTDNKFFKDVILDIKNTIERGGSLKDAFSKHKKVFPPLYIQLLAVGEASGTLDLVLRGIADYLERDDEIKKKIHSAFAYPKFIISVVAAVVIFLIIYVLPKFTGIYSQAGEQLPVPTRILLDFKNFLVHDWIIIIIFFITAYFVYRRIYVSKRGRYLIDRAKLRSPIFGKIIKLTAFSRLTHSFSLILQSGITIIDGLNIASEVMVNSYLVDELRVVREEIKQGKSLSEAMDLRKSIPKIMVRVVAAGEKSGSLDSLLEKLGELWDRDIDYTIRNLMAKLEPSMLIILGAIVGFVALAMYLPMFGLPGVYKKAL